MSKKRIMKLLEIYEDKDFFEDRAEHLERSPLALKDELIV